MLNVQEHEFILKKVLRDITNDHELNSQLVFKGGTCLYLFYGLDRFSVDLDFDLLDNKKFSVENMNSVLSSYLDLENGQFRAGKHGWLWEASYKKGLKQMQIDVSKRVYPDTYEVKQFYGLSINTLDKSSVFNLLIMFG